MLLIAGVLGGALVFLRACVPQVWGPSLPSSLVQEVSERHRTCIGVDDVPIWPGEPRQAECSSISVRPVAFGTVPPDDARNGTSKAVCFTVVVEQPYWQTMGQTRHEILTSSHTYYKVALLQNGTWTVFADEDIQDRARWALYSCPNPTQPASHLHRPPLAA